MFDEDPLSTYTYLINELNARKIGFIEAMEPSPENPNYASPYKPALEQIECIYKTFRSMFDGVWIANSELTIEQGQQIVKDGLADCVSYGRLYINNPDLVERVKNNWPLDTNYN